MTLEDEMKKEINEIAEEISKYEEELKKLYERMLEISKIKTKLEKDLEILKSHFEPPIRKRGEHQTSLAGVLQ